jgi:hypothetical protein
MTFNSRALQKDDNSWQIEIRGENGLIQVVNLPPLTKPQAIREITKRGYKGVAIYDKEVCKAIREGRVVGVVQP